MAADLAGTPSTGVRDAGVRRLSSAELRRLRHAGATRRSSTSTISTRRCPGPWEWDVKRLAASFVLAARSNGLAAADQRDAAMACVRSYRERMADYADMRALDVWYARIKLTTALALFRDKATVARLRKRLDKAAAHTVAETDFPKMVVGSGDRYVIKDNPPLIYHHQIINLTAEPGQYPARHRGLPKDTSGRPRAAARSLPADRFRVKGRRRRQRRHSVRVVLLMAEDDDPLFLQVKEARPSVLEPYVGKSVYANHGQRVVAGQRLMQAASDIFLGWTQGKRGRHFYVRQLRDMKLKPLVEVFDPMTMVDYATLCGWTLARAHARSGDAAMIAGYLGKSDVFDQAIARFARSYADQAERDHAAFVNAIRKGRIEAQMER